MHRRRRIDFPPGGVAYRHTHPGPGIRRLLFGSIRIDRCDGLSRELGPGGAWFEGADRPVLATASATEDTAFVRVLLLPAEWEGKRTIRYLDPTDEDKAEAAEGDSLLRPSHRAVMAARPLATCRFGPCQGVRPQDTSVEDDA